MLKIVRRFGKHCRCHLQGVMVRRFLAALGQVVGGELDLVVVMD
jgi:hypothetical protein